MLNKVVVYDSKGQELDKMPLDIAIDKKDFSLKTCSLAIRVLLQNWRQGTVGCKARGDVAFSNKKPWRQKGTGRARAGSLRSPLWRKGGVTFGPQPRDRKLDINRAQKKLVLNNLFFSALDADRLCCLDFQLNDDKPSSKQAANALNGMKLKDKKIVLFLPYEDEISFMSFRNIPGVSVFSYDQPNVYDLSNGQCWVFLKKDMELFKNMVLKWN